jgi:hypothetical protein
MGLPRGRIADVSQSSELRNVRSPSGLGERQTADIYELWRVPPILTMPRDGEFRKISDLILGHLLWF